MSSNVDYFYRQISLSHADASDYVRAPVLAKMPVEEFVDALFALHPSAQRLALMALKGRYEYGRLEQALKREAVDSRGSRGNTKAAAATKCNFKAPVWNAARMVS